MDRTRDTHSAGQAARTLKVNERTVKKMLERGDLEGERDAAGARRLYQASVHSLLQKRRADVLENIAQDGQRPSESVRGLRLRVEDLSYRLGRSEARVELTEKAERMAEGHRRLIEDLDRERARADRLEGELRGARRPWWRRAFGGR